MTSSTRMHPLAAIFSAMQEAFDREYYAEEDGRGDIKALGINRTYVAGLGSTMST